MTAPRFRGSLVERFHHYLVPGAPDECWEWPLSRLPKGYGRVFGPGGRHHYAHRVAWEVANGRRVPAGMLVCHTCDNPPCCNPAHLFLGTVQDNTDDMLAKGRGSTPPIVRMFGAKNPQTKLTDEQVAEIRRRAFAGSKLKVLAREFGVSPSQIGRIRNGRRSGRAVGVPA